MGYISRNFFERQIPELYPRLHRSISAFAAGSNVDVDDVLQETFLKAFKKIDQFDGESALYTWLYSIARNITIDEFRKRKRKPDRSNTPADEYGIAADEPESNEYEQKEVDDLRNAVSELSDLLRDIVVMKTLEGLSYDEISEVTGVNTETLKNRMFRAKKELAERLKKNGV
jgi:RNA polymerase sigma-70 factor (ECF subfamily)